MMRSQNEGEVQTSTGRNTGEEKVASASSVDQAGLKKGDSPSQDEKPRAKLSKTDDVMVRGSFPEKLMALLERKTAPSAIWWLPDNVNAKGTFAINKSRFEDDISQIFNGNKWSSIARNLNRW